MPIIKLMEFIEKSDEEVHVIYHHAINNFFTEGLFPDHEDAYDSQIDLEGFEEHFGSDIFNPLYNCALEHFFCNEYMNPETDTVFNVINAFLETRSSDLSKEDEEFLTGLRDSHMNLYEVIEEQKGQTIVLRSIINLEEPEDFVVELGDEELSFEKGEVFGGRIIHTSKNNVLSGCLLSFPKEVAEDVAGFAVMVSEMMMKSDQMEEFAKITSDTTLALKKVWAKEIVHRWFTELTEEAEASEMPANENMISEEDKQKMLEEVLEKIDPSKLSVN